MVRPGRAAVRPTAQASSDNPPPQRTKSFPAPTGGWNASDNVAMPSPQTAVVMDNWFPELTGVRLMGGSIRHASISGAVESLFSYHSGGTDIFFASDAEAVYEVTAPEAPDVSPTPVIVGQTSGYYSAVPFTTAGGQFLYIFNGTDDPQLFNGTAWTAINGSSAPAITGVTAADLSQGWVYRNRLLLVEKNSMNVWFPSVASLGGALQNITMNGIFRRGGSVLFGATWSLDAGDGLDDKCVIVSTEGEVAVFEGSNPAGTQESDWRLVGVYDCPRPKGKNGALRVGGDLLILTDEGAIPVSAIMQKDPAALAVAAVSRPIEPEWRREAVRRRALPWEMIKWPERNMGIVNVPSASEADPIYCYLVNLQTGAWSRRRGWDARCLHVFNGLAYFGTSDGRIMLADTGGLDDGKPYEAFLVNHFDHLDAPSHQKQIGLARAVFIAERDFPTVVGASTNYAVSEMPSPGSVADFSLDVWDFGLWDEAVWDAEGAQVPVTRWNVVGRTGFSVAWQIRVTSATMLQLKAELKSVDLTYQLGALVA